MPQELERHAHLHANVHTAVARGAGRGATERHVLDEHDLEEEEEEGSMAPRPHAQQFKSGAHEG